MLLIRHLVILLDGVLRIFREYLFKISTVSLALGSLTSTSLNLRVNAASLRILFRYSSCVVAPMKISPRLNAGFKISDNPLLPESLPVAPEPIIKSGFSSKISTAFCEDLTPSINF